MGTLSTVSVGRAEYGLEDLAADPASGETVPLKKNQAEVIKDKQNLALADECEQEHDARVLVELKQREMRVRELRNSMGRG